MTIFNLKTNLTPAGDQPAAIKNICKLLEEGKRDQVVLGVTGSGKTFTMASVIAKMGRPTIVMAHNKTLAAQLYEEFKDFFPDNAVEYFVSFYDYYQPEAYVPRNDLYIEKTSAINEQIDRMRHSATRALFERRDVIIVASVSCIYGIGDPETYSDMKISIETGDVVERQKLLKKLVELQYSRGEHSFERGIFRAKGDTVDIYPSHLEDSAWRISLFDEEVESIHSFDPLTGKKQQNLEKITIYPNSHYVVPKPTIMRAMGNIKTELKARLAELNKQNKLVEAQRIESRTDFDLEMIETTGFCNGIENYSRHLTGRVEGEPPPTLFDYLPEDALLFVDESHVSISQIGGMSRGDANRKQTLVDYGFRLPSARDNRPLRFEEWDKMRPQTIYVSATPKEYETGLSINAISELVVRPTGLLDPVVEIRPIETQVDDLMAEIQATSANGFRTLVTTLTKRMAEQLTDYLHEHGVKVRYLHSDIDTLERIEIIRDLRLGTFDVLVGINLLREGLDIPEVALVAILDADKEGFLRSSTSLIQTIGRAARNIEGKAILYADSITGSMQVAIDETTRRRKKQAEYNKTHNITPKSIIKAVRGGLGGDGSLEQYPLLPDLKTTSLAHMQKEIASLKKQMISAADDLEFELAATLRDKIHILEELYLKMG